MRQFLNGLSSFHRSSSSRRKRSSRPLKVRWVLPNQLAVGRCPHPGEGSLLTDAGIHSVLTLCNESEASIPDEIYQRFHVVRHPLPDSHQAAALTPHGVMTALNIIHTNVVHHRPIYVHCLAGMERSPTICIAYLCLFKGYGLWESLNWLKQLNPRTNPNEAQLAVVQSLIHQQHDQPMSKIQNRPQTELVSR